MIKIEGGRKTLYQWDLNQRIILDNVFAGAQVHFSDEHNIEDTCPVLLTYEENGKTFANIPNIFLQKSGIITVYIYVKKENEEHTEYFSELLVLPRKKPDDYVYTETEVLNYNTLLERINKVNENKQNKLTAGTNITIDENNVISATSGSGLTDAIKSALLNCFAHVAWTDENGQSYYNALETALNGGTPTIKYSVINNLTNATTDNETSIIEAGKSYIAHISADSGYRIDTVSCTMGGEIVDVTDNTISIESVTGNIVITAIAVEDSDLPFVSGEPYSIVWHAGKELDSTTGEETDYASFSVSDFIPVKGANRIEGIFYGGAIFTYDENKNYIGKVLANKGGSNGDIVYNSIYGDICYIKVENRTSLISTTYVTPYVDPILTETTVPQNDTFYSLPNIEVGSISSSQGGQDVEGSNSIRCGYANCLSVTTLKNIAGVRAFVYFYDAEKNYISYEISNTEHNTAVTVPENAQYFRITEATAHGYPTFVKVVK